MSLSPLWWAVVITLSTLAFAVYCVFSITRHRAFGSGSWDMGCYVHNVYLLGFLKPPVSSVLGDANFWGGTNHFMPSLVLAAPLAWFGSTSSLLVLQALCVAAAVLPMAAWAARRGAPASSIVAVAVAYLFAVGTQSMINFDVHEIAPVPVLMFAALWAFAVGRTKMGLVAVVVMAGCKESAILYACSFACALALTDKKHRRVLLWLAAAMAIWFVVVIAVIQPALLEPGARMLHVDRFEGGVWGTALRALRHPVDTAWSLVSPAPKGSSLATTTLGFAFVPLLSPSAWLFALPNLAERFLSNKREMWGLGFHYSLVLVAACAYGTLDVAARLRHSVSERAAHAVAVLVGAGFVLSLALSPVALEFVELHKSYMADDATVARYRRALTFVSDSAKVVAQNHFLPHLAFRQFIWQPQQRFVARADVVIVDSAASAWPNSPAYIAQLIASLSRDFAWRIAFHEDTTFVFVRRDTGATN